MDIKDGKARKAGECGLFRDISNEVYHTGEGISRSGIVLLKKTPFHFWNEYISGKKNVDESTKGKTIGSALHSYILERESFEKRYQIVSVATRKAKQEAAESNKHVLRKSEYEDILGMAESLHANNDVAGLIDGGLYEMTMYWRDPDFDILCKCRPDILHSNMVSDLKTTCNASEYDFSYQIYHYGYHIQAAMIQQGMEVLFNKNIRDFFFIAVEKTKPYAWAVYSLDEEAVAHGLVEFKNQLEKYKKCLESNEWPGYGIKRISLPPFILNNKRTYL